MGAPGRAPTQGLGCLELRLQNKVGEAMAFGGQPLTNLALAGFDVVANPLNTILAIDEIWMVHDFKLEWDGGFDALDFKL